MADDRQHLDRGAPLRLIDRARTTASRAWDLLTRGRERRALERRVRKLEAGSKEFRAKAESEHAALKKMSSSRHRRVLNPDIVHDVLPLRAQTLASRRVDANADAADARFQAASAAYRQAIATLAQPNPMLHRTTLQGLAWWVPTPPTLSGAALERFVGKQRFPYRNITQTRELSVGPVMLDIGANTGRMSIPRVILGDIGRAYCIEPDPLNYEALVRNIADNGLRGLVLPDMAAIGSTTGRARLRHAKYTGGHRVVYGADEGDIDVVSLRLDDWVEQTAIDPQLVTYIKVDTQGAEVHVFRGAPRLLAHRHIAWQLEVAPAMLAAAGTPARELYAACDAHFGYFIDLGKNVEGARARPIRDLADALAYLGDEAQTDILLFNTSPGGRMLEDRPAD
jgi:FkbM family methyltransferase